MTGITTSPAISVLLGLLKAVAASTALIGLALAMLQAMDVGGALLIYVLTPIAVLLTGGLTLYWAGSNVYQVIGVLLFLPLAFGAYKVKERYEARQVEQAKQQSYASRTHQCADRKNSRSRTNRAIFSDCCAKDIVESIGR